MRFVEELTFNAWPPLEVVLFDGWLLGFSDGYTRRANSVQPLYASTLPLSDKIATAEALFAARSRPMTFKITSEPADPALDSTLDGLGYVTAAPTSVQLADLTSPLPADPFVALAPTLEEAWLDGFNRLTHTPAALHQAERRLLEKIVPPHCFASFTVDGEITAVGLAVAERRHVGLFDIVVDPRARRQGLARRLCTTLLAWAQSTQACSRAYLAVLQDNALAHHLYANLGFHEAYTYWYRHKP